MQSSLFCKISGKLGLLLLSFVLMRCQSLSTPSGEAESLPPSHKSWNQQLSQFVVQDGTVQYAAWLQQQDSLTQYLAELSAKPPAASWSEAERLAYWINAYNAFTVQLILNHYPLESIRDLHTVPLVATIWHEAWFEIGGKPMSLNHIEHEILRKDFSEPRIHFAINCASLSCPVLRPEAYVPERLEAQLTDQAHLFLTQPLRNIITEEELELSQIFLWFRGDFTTDGSLIEFLNQYAPVNISTEADISYLSYDWSLNEA